MSQVKITLDGKTIEIQLDQNGETILNAAIDAGLDAPYSCKGGVCTTCQCKVTKGEVSMEKNHALTPREIESGLVLACQAHPISEDVEITWDL